MKIENFTDFHYHKLDGILPEKYRDLVANWYMEHYTKRHDKLMAPVLAGMMHQHGAVVPLDNLDWVEIETVNRCNRKCPFCPTNADTDPRGYLRMSDEVYKKIVDDFAGFGYSGCIALFCNNEPAMDPKIVERMRYMKDKLPAAFKFTYTNADLLTPEKFKEWADLLDGGVIDCYSPGVTDPSLPADDPRRYMTPQVRAIYDAHGDEYPGFVIWIKRASEVLGTKGGMAPNRRKPKYRQRSGCYMPFMHMYIDPAGRVRLCCQDALWKHPPLGDLTKQSIADVWNGPGYVAVRDHFLCGRLRCEKEVCDGCDVFHMGKNRHDITKDKYAEKMVVPKV